MYPIWHQFYIAYINSFLHVRPTRDNDCKCKFSLYSTSNRVLLNRRKKYRVENEEILINTWASEIVYSLLKLCWINPCLVIFLFLKTRVQSHRLISRWIEHVIISAFMNCKLWFRWTMSWQNKGKKISEMMYNIF